MAPEDRRAVIIKAAIPLLRARGWSLTTKEIAVAARVAEGTIFGVFESKDEILVAALQAALDPQPAVQRLSEIDLSLPVEERLRQAVEILQSLATQVWEMTSILRAPEVRGRLPQRYTGDYFAHEVLPRLFEPSRDELSLEPAAASQALVVLAMSGSNPLFFERPLTAAQIVALVLDGARRPPRGPESAAGG